MTREGAPDLGNGRGQVAGDGLLGRLRQRFDQPTRRRLDVHRRELRRELFRLHDRRRLLAMGLLIVTFGLLAAGIVARGEPAGADARAYWAGVRIWLNGGDPYHPTGPFLPYVYAPWMLPLFAPWALLPWDVAWFVWRGGTILLLLWTIHWAYRQRPLETAILVALLAFPFGANLDTGNINLQLTLLLWGAQFTGPVVAGLLWSVATWMKWAPVLLLPILAPRARLWGLVFLAASAVLSLATLPLTILQLQALFGFGARPLRLDYLVFLWAIVPVLWRRPEPFSWLRPASWRAAIARLRAQPEGAGLGQRVRDYLGLGA
jgi:Glycosyltransferase family 87